MENQLKLIFVRVLFLVLRSVMKLSGRASTHGEPTRWIGINEAIACFNQGSITSVTKDVVYKRSLGTNQKE